MTAVPARGAPVRFALALLLVAFCSTAALAQSESLVFGHRGARDSAPDNSLLSFRTAEAEGADGVELDARLTKSGEVVVFHDAKVTLPDKPADARRALRTRRAARARRTQTATKEHRARARTRARRPRRAPRRPRAR